MKRLLRKLTTSVRATKTKYDLANISQAEIKYPRDCELMS